MQTIRNIRQRSQQLVNPAFSTPKELVTWMGAMQAQDYTMAKWAIGVRMKDALSEQAIEEAFNKGEILRTHVMRPTWHFVTPENIRWMLKLSARRIKSAYKSYMGNTDASESFYMKAQEQLIKMLEGGRSLTRQEIALQLSDAGIDTSDPRIVYRILGYAEVDGVICSGGVKGKKQTYALLDERVPPMPELSKEEALLRLARNYFQSHSPASLTDFVWWSGLSVTEARTAIHLIKQELTEEHLNGKALFVHQSCDALPCVSDICHLIPSYDEYIISYKDRTDVLDAQHSVKAFSSNGIFQPIVFLNGEIVGNWKKSVTRKQLIIDQKVFDGKEEIPHKLWKKAEERYKGYVNG